MVVQLRRTLDEKTKKNESLNQKQNESKKAESEEVVNKAIKMVVINSAIGILFKLPVCFIPLLNLIAKIFYRINNGIVEQYHSSLHIFYSIVFEFGFNSLLQDTSYFFYTFSLSIQLFIYNRFDKKFRTGFDRLKEKIKLKIKSLKSNSNSKTN